MQYADPGYRQMEFQNVEFKYENSNVTALELVNWADALNVLEKIQPMQQELPINNIVGEHLTEGLLLGWQEGDRGWI